MYTTGESIEWKAHGTQDTIIGAVVGHVNRKGAIELGSQCHILKVQCIMIVRSKDVRSLRIYGQFFVVQKGYLIVNFIGYKVIPLVRPTFADKTVDLTTGMHCIQEADRWQR